MSETAARYRALVAFREALREWLPLEQFYVAQAALALTAGNPLDPRPRLASLRTELAERRNLIDGYLRGVGVTTRFAPGDTASFDETIKTLDEAIGLYDARNFVEVALEMSVLHGDGGHGLSLAQLEELTRKVTPHRRKAAIRSALAELRLAGQVRAQEGPIRIVRGSDWNFLHFERGTFPPEHRPWSSLNFVAHHLRERAEDLLGPTTRESVIDAAAEARCNRRDTAAAIELLVLAAWIDEEEGGIRINAGFAVGPNPEELMRAAPFAQPDQLRGDLFWAVQDVLSRTTRPPTAEMQTKESPMSSPLDVVTRLCERFHRVALSLRHRHDSRPALEISDEYDVQDLLRALLQIDFDDVRNEEWSPSYAGGCSRMDFLMRTERLVVETKMARKGLTAKKVGEELIIDIARYAKHPDCGALVCFIYDPGGSIQNPAGLASDLSRAHDGLSVRVLIRPEH